VTVPSPPNPGSGLVGAASAGDATPATVRSRVSNLAVYATPPSLGQALGQGTRKR
jgi:hypothetical protein